MKSRNKIAAETNLPAAAAGTETKPDFLLELLDWLKYILIAVLIGLLLVVFVIQRNSVIGNSMVPNLHDNDQLLVEKLSKLFHGIDYGDIITISTRNLPEHDEGPNIVKRVVGLPGDTIEIRADGVWRNDEKLDESDYLTEGTTTRIRNLAYAKVTLGADEYYVLGDNRDVSLDSRSFGPVPIKSIIGTVLLRFYPFAQFGAP
ncbi:MAG TPA: signal peptidase I [Clostridiales bacterium]|nr:signal peptidase I [Clostridiales bacterium]